MRSSLCKPFSWIALIAVLTLFPRNESLVSAAVQWAERIMRKIDGVYGKAN
jgi:hypothetical protein